MIETGKLVTVKVDGLPSKRTNFTYRTTYPVSIGTYVMVPVPRWAERLIGNDPLPGVVTAEQDERAAYVYDIRDILPKPPEASITAKRDLISEWRKMADALEDQAAVYRSLANELESTL